MAARAWPEESPMNSERLVNLFRAYSENNDEAFRKTADAIIADELMANHHAQARDLKKAISAGKPEKPPGRVAGGLSALPKDKRFGESLISVVQPSLSASRVILAPQAKSQILRVIDEHSQRSKLAKYGYSPKTKLLFWGPPGCGKTLVAHWIASELGLPLGLVKLNSLITSFLGETAAHIQRVFDAAQSSPMVLLIDEADAIAKDRNDRNDVGELKRVVNSLLQAMDTFRSKDSILIAASNHQYLFDDALWRRFDDFVTFSLPTQSQIRTLLLSTLNGVPVSGDVDAAARSAKGLSFAEVEKVLVEAVKTMILQDSEELPASELSLHFKRYKSLLRKAQTPNPSKRHANE